MIFLKTRIKSAFFGCTSHFFLINFLMLPFLLVHDPVCFLQNYFRRKFFMFLRHFHDPAAETHCIRFAAVTAELVLHPVDFVPCNAYRTVSQDNAELVSTDSGKNISFTDIILHRLCKMPDIPVSLRMPKCIIDIFQMVKVTVTENQSLTRRQKFIGFSWKKICCRLRSVCRDEPQP